MKLPVSGDTTLELRNRYIDTRRPGNGGGSQWLNDRDGKSFTDALLVTYCVNRLREIRSLEEFHQTVFLIFSTAFNDFLVAEADKIYVSTDIRLHQDDKDPLTCDYLHSLFNWISAHIILAQQKLNDPLITKYIEFFFKSVNTHKNLVIPCEGLARAVHLTRFLAALSTDVKEDLLAQTDEFQRELSALKLLLLPFLKEATPKGGLARQLSNAAAALQEGVNIHQAVTDFRDAVKLAQARGLFAKKPDPISRAVEKVLQPLRVK